MRSLFDLLLACCGVNLHAGRGDNLHSLIARSFAHDWLLVCNLTYAFRMFMLLAGFALNKCWLRCWFVHGLVHLCDLLCLPVLCLGLVRLLV